MLEAGSWRQRQTESEKRRLKIEATTAKSKSGGLARYEDAKWKQVELGCIVNRLYGLDCVGAAGAERG